MVGALNAQVNPDTADNPRVEGVVVPDRAPRACPLEVRLWIAGRCDWILLVVSQLSHSKNPWKQQ